MAMFRELPRAGTSLTRQDIVAACQYMFTADNTFTEAFASWLSTEHIWVVSSGRVALYLILCALAERSSRQAVIVPAYTCPTVPLAVARAGLQVKLCDVDPATGNLDLEQLDELIEDDILAVVPVHMHGIPCDMRAILTIVQQHSVFVVEDCAQSAGATLDGQKTGTFGDAAFFSLGRGKGFTAYEGGIGVGELGSSGADFPSSIRAEVTVLIKLVAMTIFFHPRLYWPIRALPLGWGNEVYDMDFDIRGMGNFRQGVALSVLKRLDTVLTERRERAATLQERLRPLAGVRFLELPVGGQPSYPWLPLILEDRDETVRQLRKRGLGASLSFSKCLNQYEYLQGIVPPGNFPNAEYIATHLLTLPTHKYVTQQDMDQMVIVITEAVRR